MPPFSRQKRPRATFAPPHVRAAVFSLAVTIVIVTTPNRPDRSVHLQYRIDDLQRVHDHWIIGPSYPITHEMKRSEEHTSELQSRLHLVCRLLLEKKKKNFKRLIAQRHHQHATTSS